MIARSDAPGIYKNKSDDESLFMDKFHTISTRSQVSKKKKLYYFRNK